MPSTEKTCFVVMGFGKKTDFQSNPQRILDLDKTYDNVIKPAVEEAGLKCVRADEVIHSGVIDAPMYELLLKADVVIADLSTSNANALYELGVRHALRPHTTLVIAEEGFKFPFDLNHVLILPYKHLGEDIGFSEAKRMSLELKKRVAALAENAKTDSPVFTVLPELQSAGLTVAMPIGATEAVEASQNKESVSTIMDHFRSARAKSNWNDAKVYLSLLKDMQPNDPFVLQQLALATYKSKQPDVQSSLHEAKAILEPLGPETSSDAETVGIWGAIHKRLWEVEGQRDDLDTALRAYQRGFFFRNDYYNGINYAFLLDVRASQSTGDEAIADRVVAKRVRQEILEICEAKLADPASALDAQETFWVVATKVEALMALGRTQEAEALKVELIEQAPEAWMVTSMEEQLRKLQTQSPPTQ